MKRMIRASEMSEQFLAWHDDPDNYENNRDNFDRVYKILDKYGDESESVDEVFKKASYEDQEKMLRLIKPKQEATLGSVEYVINSYHNAHAGNLYEPEYADGWADAIDACIDAGLFSDAFVKKLRRGMA